SPPTPRIVCCGQSGVRSWPGPRSTVGLRGYGDYTMTRPTTADLAAAYGRAIPDVIARDLAVLFCGINPGLWSAAPGQQFAPPGNRFWPALHRSGFTPRQLSPQEQGTLLSLRLGVTNLVERGSARADELTDEELRAGAETLDRKLRRHRPAWLAVL